MKKKSSNLIGLILGLFGGLIGLAVGLWAPFILKLSDTFNLIFLASIGVITSLLLFSLALYLLFSLRDVFKLASVLVLYGILQLSQGIFTALKYFDKDNILGNIDKYFQFDLFGIMPIAFAAFFIPFIFFQIYSILYINTYLKNKILRTGYRTQATIIAARETNMRVNKRRIYSIQLRIHSQYFGDYEHTLERYISPLEIQRFTKDSRIELMVNPKNREQVFLLN